MAQTATLRIHWGYWMFYAAQPWHHENYPMDGGLSIENGHIRNPELIEFWGGFGACCERMIPLAKPRWRRQCARANKRLGGVRFVVEGDADTVVRFSTRTIDFTFTLGEILAGKEIRHHIGERESCMDVVALLDGYDPNLDSAEDIAAMAAAKGRWCRLLHAQQFQGSIHRWYKTDWAWVSPGTPLEVTIPRPEWSAVEPGGSRVCRAVFRSVAAVPVNSPASDPGTLERYRNVFRDLPAIPKGRERDPEHVPEVGTAVTLPYRVFLNDEKPADSEHFFPKLRAFPMPEEVVVDLPESAFTSGENLLRVEADSTDGYLLIARLWLEEVHQYDFEIVAAPRWVLLGEPFFIKLLCRKPAVVDEVSLPRGIVCLDEIPRELGIGEHRFRFRADEPLANATVAFKANGAVRAAHIEQVVAIKAEPFPMRVGLEALTISHDAPGQQEAAIIELSDTQLGDYIIFRPQVYERMSEEKAARWARLCREYGIYHCVAEVQREYGPMLATMAREGGKYFLGAGIQEWDGDLFGYRRTMEQGMPYVPPEDQTMKTAEAAHLDFMRKGIASHLKGNDVPMRLNISVTGHSLAYRAGADMAVAQFNKSHNGLLVADARGAARAHRKSVWSAYIAGGAHVQPETDAALRMWWLALHFAYVCGALYANDEESLYRNYHENLYAHGDRFPRTKQEILRAFNRYVKSHPHRRMPTVKQALLIGKYACDVTHGLTDTDQPARVWGTYGPKTPQWLHGTPEYGLRYLDAFLPGVWLHSLVQSPAETRHWYSGSPCGEIEMIPIAAPDDVLREFKLLLLLGWNTMCKESYAGLKRYVEGGGKLFMAVPHLTMHESRDFLDRMDALRLFRGGDVTDLFGVNVKGKGGPVWWIRSLQGSGLGEDRHFDLNNAVGPVHPEVHLAEVDLADADVLAADGDTGRPVLVRRRIGRGEAYLLLTNEYPGNSRLVQFMTEVVHALARDVESSVRLEDSSGDVYYTIREEEGGLTRVHLLNTDWTEAANERKCALRLNAAEVPLVVREGRLSEVVRLGDLAVLVEDGRTHVETISTTPGRYSVRAHGSGKGEILICHLQGKAFKTIALEGRDLQLEPRGGWGRVSFDFGSRSIGDLVLRVQE